MLLVEVNVLGLRFTRSFSDRREVLRHSPRLHQWRQWRPGHRRAVA